MVFHDVAFLPSSPSMYTTFLEDCGRCYVVSPTTRHNTVFGGR